MTYTERFNALAAETFAGQSDCEDCARIIIAEADERIAELEERIAELEEALAPFAHPDLRKVTSNMVQGDASPVWGKEKALLTLGDFRRASAALKEGE